jgi:hypothetical protein
MNNIYQSLYFANFGDCGLLKILALLMGCAYMPPIKKLAIIIKRRFFFIPVLLK